ncbi:integrase core domain-containing protein [Candidatus Woesearchaeota archaeon]|nr:integrase core domain-containing protein [Candidatus Woesearchaeota archaeon]
MFKGFESEETAKIWLDAWFAYYNFLRPHLSLKGKTFAEACGIDLNIENDWEDLITGAAYHQTKLARCISNGTRM